jgi:hypothetical protein
MAFSVVSTICRGWGLTAAASAYTLTARSASVAADWQCADREQILERARTPDVIAIGRMSGVSGRKDKMLSAFAFVRTGKAPCPEPSLGDDRSRARRKRRAATRSPSGRRTGRSLLSHRVYQS